MLEGGIFQGFCQGFVFKEFYYSFRQDEVVEGVVESGGEGVSGFAIGVFDVFGAEIGKFVLSSVGEVNGNVGY